MKYVIGIDQGSTKTHTAICDEFGNIIAVSKTDGAEHHNTGIDYQIQKISEVCHDLFNQSGISKSDVKLIFGGLTGVDWDGEDELLKRSVQKLGICKNIYVVNDSIAALRGGTTKNYGAVICAGTGSNCAVISPDGREFIYGYYIEKNLQGGTGLSSYVLDAVYRSHMGRIGSTSLTSRVLEKFNEKELDIILKASVENRLDSKKKISLALDLFEAAYEGDEISANIIGRFGIGLAGLVNARAKIFKMENTGFEVIVSGSIFKGPGSLLTDVVTSEIHMVCPKALIISARYEPVIGAVILGLEKLHGILTTDIYKNIDTSCIKLGLLRDSENQE